MDVIVFAWGMGCWCCVDGTRATHDLGAHMITEQVI